LIELMVVVTIVAILAALAIPAFIGYAQRARTTEGFTMLGEIRQRQEAYRAEFGRYCGNPNLAWNPASYAAPGSVQSFDATDPNWAQLGVDPDGPVRFRYQVLTGLPGTTPAGISGFTGDDYWYVVQAEADLDGDGQTVALETYSEARSVYVSRGVGGTYLAQGWE
jgi:type II secretory pathway pseudopilin PulG